MAFAAAQGCRGPVDARRAGAGGDAASEALGEWVREKLLVLYTEDFAEANAERLEVLRALGYAGE